MTRRGLMGTAPIDYGTGETLNDPARLDDAALRQPLRWKRPRKVFVCSMTDVAGSWVPDAWLDAIWAVMALAPQHTYLVLTKRPSRLWEWFRSDPYERVLRFADQVLRRERPELTGIGISNPQSAAFWPHVWIGVTIESDRYVWRASILRQIPAHVRWVSAEPLLSGLPSLDLTGIEWCVLGGESGPGSRPMEDAWVHDVAVRCRATGTAVFVKQMGTVWERWYRQQFGRHPGPKGADPEFWPEHLRLREFPRTAAPGAAS